jgi:molybdopterin-containing oxidoreductase family iron-sulfur binding subunit
MHWGMVIDLKLCIGCNTCVVVCKMRNGTPKGIFWNRVLEEEVGTFPAARRVFWPVRCMQCEDPACVEACPTGASYKREDNLVLIDAEKCVGCAACILACPYDVRFLWDGKGGYFNGGLTPYEEKVYPNHLAGAVQKCDFCASRIDDGIEPSCAQGCLTGAIMFGDLDNPDSDASRALAGPRVRLRLREELGTRPSIYYLT